MTRPSVVAVFALAAGCSGSTKKQPDPLPAAAAPAPAIAAAPNATTDAKGCVHDGRWRACGLVDRLEKSGLVVKALPDTARYDFLSIPGVRYTLGRGEAQAFFYPDSAALAKDFGALDTVRVTPKGTTRHWDVPATLVRSGNLLVLVLTGNEHLVERVQLAVEAGAPQPEPPAGAQTLPAATSH